LVDDQTKGYLCVATAAVMWASSGTAGRALIDAGITPSELVQIRVTFSSAILAPIFLVSHRSLLKVRVQDLARLAVLGGVLMASVQITYFYAISKIQVMAAILLQYLAPVMVGAFSMAVWHERFTAAKALALVLAVGGCYLVVGGHNLDLFEMNRLGIVGGLASAVSFALYALLGERVMQRYRPWTVVFYALLFAAVTWQVVYEPFAFLWASYSPAQWAWLVYIVVVGTLLPYGLYFMGINHIRSTRALITATLEPISAGIMAWIFLGQTLEPAQLLGAVLVVSAIVVLQVRHEKDNLAPHVVRNRAEGHDR
jgi:drug/metabolite transporter (DMT)-like permease